MSLSLEPTSPPRGGDSLGDFYVNSVLVGSALPLILRLFSFYEGKSYSMMGAPGAPGMIPRGCEEIFRIVDTNDVADLTVRIAPRCRVGGATYAPRVLGHTPEFWHSRGIALNG